MSDVAGVAEVPAPQVGAAWLERFLKAPAWLVTPFQASTASSEASFKKAGPTANVGVAAPAESAVRTDRMSHAELERRVEDIALNLGARMKQRRASQDPRWGELADVLEAVRALPDTP